ncbi:MAG: hypothetical protein L0099_14360 [Acidobacteria bacterium]|nr:hypothetical protein [Acidobacteriota bacterium]
MCPKLSPSQAERRLARPGSALGLLLLASGLYAQPPPQNPIEVVYSTNSSNAQILKLDFATGTSTVVNTDAGLRKRLEGLAARNDGATVSLLVCDSARSEVLFYENATGAGQPIATEIAFPDSVSLDLAGNAYVVRSANPDDGSPGQVWKLPRGGTRPGGYDTPILIDENLPSERLADTKVVSFSSGQLQRGDLLVLSRTPAMIFRYPKLDCEPSDSACTGFGPRQVFVPESGFPPRDKPTGLAFAPNLDLLVSGHTRVLRYHPNGHRVQPDFASGSQGVSRIAVGIQVERSYAFVASRSGRGMVQRFLINEDGTGTPDGAVTDKVSKNWSQKCLNKINIQPS